jgi:hypothetical protein
MDAGTGPLVSRCCRQSRKEGLMRIISLLLFPLGLLVIAESGGARTAADEAGAVAAAVPLLEVEARGMRFPFAERSVCEGCVSTSEPLFISQRIAVMAGGTVVGALTENRTDDPSSGATTELFRGTASPQQLETLRSDLAAARVGFERGGCSVVRLELVSLPPMAIYNVYRLAYTVLWYGRGNRFNLFELPVGSPPCAAPLHEMLTDVIAVARDVQERSGD